MIPPVFPAGFFDRFVREHPVLACLLILWGVGLLVTAFGLAVLP